jgi:O-antigen/teichoic acid export membrane protein
VAALLGGINSVIWALVLVAAAKAILLFVLPTVRYGWQLWFGPVFRWLDHTKYAVPWGASSSVYLLRQQADHWIVVMLFSSAQYGMYSIGAVAIAVASVLRVTVNNVIFPEMSKAQAEGNLARVLNLNNRSNVVASLFIFPVLCYLFAAASPIIRLIYTDAYTDAIPILRLNIVAFLTGTVEMTTVMYALRQGPYLFGMESISLLVGLLASYAGTQVWGLPGAALGLIVGGCITIVAVYARACPLAGLRFRASQDWRSLARIGGASVIAGGVANLTILLLPPTTNNLLASLVSGIVFCIAYLFLLVGFGQWTLITEVLALRPELLHRLWKRTGRR